MNYEDWTFEGFMLYKIKLYIGPIIFTLGQSKCFSKQYIKHTI